MLKVDLQQLERKRRLRIDEAVPPDDTLWTGLDVRLETPLDVRLEAQFAGHDLLVRGELEGEFVLPCRRCLVDVAVKLQEEVAFLYRRGLSAIEAEEQEIFPLPERGDEVDLRDAIKEHVMLSVPRFAVCDDACRGLCPHCGTNLNQTQCDCSPVEVDDRWAALRKLRTD
jgi:DUF177 domain-containing protein